jgi:alcohol dehydrogenase class IV
MADKFHVPRITFHGLGSFENLKEIKGKKAIIVTGKSSMQKAGYLDKAINLLKDNSIDSVVFNGVEPDPSIETVMKGVEVFNKEQPNLIIGLGGCSAIDAAKAMWIFYEYPDYTFEDIIVPFGIKPLRNKAIFVAIPSTSGTGTEVTCASVITDRSKGIKHPIVTYEITPDYAIVDGELCKSMAPNVTADTGMDALCHDCEVFVSTIADYYTDPVAMQSIKMIFEYLPKAYQNGDDLEARQVMHDASCLAGMAFTNALLGIVHAMAHQLGGMFGIPHGRANALLLPNVIRYNSKSTNKYTELAKLFGKLTSEEYAQEVENLRKTVGIEDSIKEYGIEEERWQEKLATITENASKDACVGTNPRVPTLEDLKGIYQACYTGEKVDF